MIEYLHAGGHRLEFQWIEPGRPGLPALVWLHQGLGSVSMWRDFPVKVAERTGCGALVYSRHGHGNSDVLAAPRPEDFMEIEGDVVLPEVLRARGLEDVILIGHSDGGTAALAYAGMGHRLRALVVVAPHVCLEAATLGAIIEQRANWAGSVSRERLARHHLDADALFKGWSDVWLSLQSRGWSIEHLLDGITCPVLAIQGREDTHGTMIQIDNIALRARGPVQLEKWDHCGHDPFRDQPERMLDTLAAFVAQQSRCHWEGECE